MRKNISTILLIAALFVSSITGILYVSSSQLSRGEPVQVSPVPAGKDGAPGKDGRGAYAIWVENGFTGTQHDFLMWLKGATGSQGPAGEAGPKGEKGDKGDSGDVGPQGPQGAQGLTGQTGPKGDKGETGQAGPHVDISCVIKSTNGLATRYVAWKLPNEPIEGYKLIYMLPSWAQCVNPVTIP